MGIRTYSELMSIPSFLERYEYCRIGGRVGEETFGFERYLNQVLYSSRKWKNDFRPAIIIRDYGLDLGCEDMEIGGRIIVHHLNPLTIDDVINRSAKIFDPENVICVSHMTHEAIHYGDSNLLPKEPVIRTVNDTCPWR